MKDMFGCLFGGDAADVDADAACEDMVIGAEADMSNRYRHGRQQPRGRAHQKSLPKKSRRSLFGEDETDANVIPDDCEIGDDVYDALVEAEATDPYALGM